MKKILLFSVSFVVLSLALSIGQTSKAANPLIPITTKPDWGVQCWVPSPAHPVYSQHWYYVTQQGVSWAVAQCESIPGAYVGTITQL